MTGRRPPRAKKSDPIQIRVPRRSPSPPQHNPPENNILINAPPDTPTDPSADESSTTTGIFTPPETLTSPSADESSTTAGILSSTSEDLQMSPEPSQPGSPDRIPVVIPPILKPPPRDLMEKLENVASSIRAVASSSGEESRIVHESSSASMSPGASHRIVSGASGGKATSSFSGGGRELTSATSSMAPVAVGTAIPDGTLAYLDDDNNPQSLSIHSLIAGKKVIIFGVPSAFTPTCTMKHVPSFIERAQELKGKGVDELIYISANDPFVMNSWAKTFPDNKHVKFLADGLAKYTYALGLELDLAAKGFAIRSWRFALLVDNLQVKVANVEDGGEFKVSSAEEILKAL